MARVLVTGMSGAGKSTVLAELRRRGRLSVDTDYDGWTLPDGRWDEPRMAALLAVSPDVAVPEPWRTRPGSTTASITSSC